MQVANLRTESHFGVPAFLSLSGDEVNALTAQIVSYAKESFGTELDHADLLQLVMRHMYFLERGDPARASMTLDCALAQISSAGQCHG